MPFKNADIFFSETFAAIGCAEYFKATNDLKAWEKAEWLFDTMYELYSNPDLTSPKYNPMPSPTMCLGMRSIAIIF